MLTYSFFSSFSKSAIISFPAEMRSYLFPLSSAVSYLAAGFQKACGSSYENAVNVGDSIENMRNIIPIFFKTINLSFVEYKDILS